jgi:hypothetical protein
MLISLGFSLGFGQSYMFDAVMAGLVPAIHALP